MDELSAQVVTTVDGEEFFDEEITLAVLLRDGRIFANSVPVGDGYQVCLFVFCSDIFAWGLADAESFGMADIEPLYRAHATDPVWGVAKWCCHKRQMQPQTPIIHRMKEADSWDQAMEALPENPCNK